LFVRLSSVYTAETQVHRDLQCKRGLASVTVHRPRVFGTRLICCT